MLTGWPVIAHDYDSFQIKPHSAKIELRERITEKELNEKTKVVVLGTGTPIPDAFRAASSIAIVHKGESYLFDIGAGAVHNATRARYKYDIPSLYPTEIDAVFITHLHSDHILDYSELNYTLWWRRRAPLMVFGPIGTEEMSKGMVAMMAPDVRIRTSGNQPVMNPDAHIPVVKEITDGLVFEKGDLRVEAFSVPHGDVKPSYGYRVTTEDLSVVISGDTAYSEAIKEKSRDVDILFHEYISDEGLLRNSLAFQAYHKKSHTTTTDLAEIVNQAKPGLLVLYHGLHYGLPEKKAIEEVRAIYDGEVILADDLDIFPAN